jgi:hypothetical protein
MANRSALPRFSSPSHAPTALAALGVLAGALLTTRPAGAETASVSLAEPTVSDDGPGPSRGLSLGARVGAGIPMGDYQTGKSLSDVYAATVPFALDAGYLYSPKLYVGAYYSIAPAFLGGTTRNNADDGNVTRLGLNVHYHLMPQKTLDPWVGLGMGYERAAIASTPYGLGLHQNRSLNAFEVLNLQVGADYKVTPGFGVGPVVTATLADYLCGDYVLSDKTRIETTKDGWHGWLMLGIRGVYNFGF